MNHDLISCVVPVFNGERYLREALDSILAQTYQPLELIVVDDGSTDGTATLAAGYGERIRYLWQANAGEASARNRGLSAAQGEFIAFLDADDLWHPEKLTRQVARFHERPELDLSFTWFQNFWVPELAEEAKLYQKRMLAQPVSAYGISTFVTRRSGFTKFGSFNTTEHPAAASMLWFLRAVERGAAIEIWPEVLTYRRLHAANLSRTNTLEGLFPILRAWRDYQRRLHRG
jgi:glycosyltransferase involved in cell wall biosynthesis